MMTERFASAADDILVVITIELDRLTFVATTDNSRSRPAFGRDRNPTARHDGMVPCHSHSPLSPFFKPRTIS